MTNKNIDTINELLPLHSEALTEFWDEACVYGCKCGIVATLAGVVCAGIIRIGWVCFGDKIKSKFQKKKEG